MFLVEVPRRILVINPNTSTSITETFKPVIAELRFPHEYDYTYWTSPQGPAMIKSEADLSESASQCLPLLLGVADKFDGFLAACYADHPLVHMLRAAVAGKPVVSIFEASLLAAIGLVGESSTFGIVTTAVAYEIMLDTSVKRLLGNPQAQKLFAGTCATHIGLQDLQPGHEPRAERKIVRAATNLLEKSKGTVDVVCMGGVILGGMEAWVRRAFDAEKQGVKIVDQLLAGMLILDAMLNHTPMEEVEFDRVLR
jgi:Asp/Glu/hydantoin racemase